MNTGKLSSDVSPHDPVRAVSAFSVVMADPDATLRQIGHLMGTNDCGIVVIQQRGGETSVVSERDIVRALGTGEDADHTWAVDVMSGPAMRVDADESLIEAAELMTAAGVRHLVVDDPDNNRMGIVSLRDIIQPILAAVAES